MKVSPVTLKELIISLQGAGLDGAATVIIQNVVTAAQCEHISLWQAMVNLADPKAAKNSPEYQLFCALISIGKEEFEKMNIHHPL